jgi:hypothetical protein
MNRGFAYGSGYMLTPGTTIAWAELPSCVTPSLTYYPLGSQHSPTTAPKGHSRLMVVSIEGFSVGAYQRVREYQPVVHRLRLSASP